MFAWLSLVVDALLARKDDYELPDDPLLSQ
jgi:hypothetical protein